MGNYWGIIGELLGRKWDEKRRGEKRRDKKRRDGKGREG